MIKNVRAFILEELERCGGEVSQTHLYEEAWRRDDIIRKKAGKARVNGMIHERLTAMIQDGLIERVRIPHAMIRLCTQPETKTA